MNNKRLYTDKLKLKRNAISSIPFFEHFFEIIEYILLLGMFPFLSGFALYFEIERNNYLEVTIILFTIMMIISMLLLYSILSINKLKKVKGISQTRNQEIITEISVKYNWEIIRHTTNYTLIKPSWNFLSTNWGQEITIIYDSDIVLINCITYGLQKRKSPFHWFGNRRKEKFIIEEFNKRIV